MRFKLFATLGIVAFGFAAAMMWSSCDPCPKCPGPETIFTFIPIASPSSSATPPITSTVPGSGLFVIDSTSKRAYVPLINNHSGAQPQTCSNGRVSVINLQIDPNTADPRITTICLTNPGTPTGSAANETAGTVFVVADAFLYEISEATNTVTLSVPFPSGTVAGGFGQIIFDPQRNKAVVAAQGNNAATTGFSIYDPATHTFGPIIPANYPETFAFDVAKNQVLDASDSNGSGNGVIVDVASSSACGLADPNIGGDQDGASVDATTSINVISNEDGTVTVINLNGATLSGSGTPSCTVNEAGAPPNSVHLMGLPGGTAGSAVNPLTHQAFLIVDGGSGITLLSMPSSPVTQLMAANLSFVTSSVPNTPQNSSWQTQGDPYAVAVAPTPNKGYAVDSSSLFLVQVDLATFQSNPGAINTALPPSTPSQSCKCGTPALPCMSTANSCANGAGVVFFPLADVQ